LGENLSRRRQQISPITIVIAIVIMFLIGKFLGLLQIFNIDPFGVEPEWVYGVLAIGIGVLYKELRDLGKEVRGRLQNIDNTLSILRERLATLETKADIKTK